MENPIKNLIEISDFNEAETALYAARSEAALVHFLEPKPGLFIAESPKVVRRALDAGYIPRSFLVEKRLLDDGAIRSLLTCREQVPVYTAGFDLLTGLTGFPLTQGLLCAMYRPVLPSVEAVCSRARRIAVLEQVVNPTNVGAIFRSAAALNMDAVLLAPSCSDPLYRRAIRVSMGTVFQIPWTYLENVSKDANTPGADIAALRRLGFATAAMALRDDSVSIDDPALAAEERLAIVLGSEGDGLTASTIAACDYTVRIPMAHSVDSLNVAAASAVAFWQLQKRDI